MVIAGQDVLDAEPDEIEPARRDSTVDINAGGPRRLTERYLALAAAGANIAEGLVMFAQKGAPVLIKVETAMRGIAAELDVNRCARLVGVGAADPYSPGAAAAGAEFHLDAAARRFRNRFR